MDDKTQIRRIDRRQAFEADMRRECDRFSAVRRHYQLWFDEWLASVPNPSLQDVCVMSAKKNQAIKEAFEEHQQRVGVLRDYYEFWEDGQ